MPVLLDTNILLRSVQPGHSLFASTTNAVQKLIISVDRILTFNTADFARYTRVTAVHPASV